MKSSSLNYNDHTGRNRKHTVGNEDKNLKANFN